MVQSIGKLNLQMDSKWKLRKTLLNGTSKLGDDMKVKAFGNRILGQMINPSDYIRNPTRLLIADKYYG